MNASAQTMRSPASPYTSQSYASHRESYPTSPHSNKSSSSPMNRGLGLYPVSMPPSQVPIVELAHTSQAGNWSHPAVMDHEYTTQAPSTDLFARYDHRDPFSGFCAGTNTGMSGASSDEAPGLDFSNTPPNSNLQSHRSSVSSYSASEAYSPSGSEYALGCTPKVKLEETGEWYPSPSNEHILQRQGSLVYTPGQGTVPSQTEELYRHQSDSGYMTEMHTSPDPRMQRFDVHPILSNNATRIKKKRQRTTRDEATHECGVCGKLFKRSYNWKSHQETHNPERKYPHPCTTMIGNTQCTKKFQRKTDLDRHVDSVHLKARNHKCDLCGHRFARRDTLRRHTEDGCPKRFELGIRDTSVVTPQQARWSFSTYPNQIPRARSFSVGIPQQSHTTTPPMAPPVSAASSTFPVFNRPDYTPSTGHSVYPS
ncbi:MAG: hypothetical protein MMC33_005785 [Icmadophila ericetorum]|nr:hypothetical protein [Icmadophila ericetorum]